MSTRHALEGDEVQRRRILTPAEASQRIGLSTSWLAKLRLTGEGPPFIKLGRHRVGYDSLDVEAWLDSRRRTSTSEEELRSPKKKPPPAGAAQKLRHRPCLAKTTTAVQKLRAS